MQRRSFLAATAAVSVARPAFGQGTSGAARLLKFIPQSDLAVLDPIVTTAYVTRHHAYMVFDTLYGFDQDYQAQPQMVDGHTLADGARTVTMKLREGL